MEYATYGKKELLREEVETLKELEEQLGEPLYRREERFGGVQKDSLKYYFSAEDGKVVRLNLGGWDVCDVTLVGHLKHLKNLGLAETDVSDLSPLKNLEELRELNIRETKVSDLTHLRGLMELKRLQLWDTDVSDVSPLRDLKGLEELTIKETKVSDLSPLEGLENLESVGVDYHIIGKNEDLLEKLKERGVNVWRA
ncbi:MAG: leucine-rich repeat domain-containing protein [Candidatus Korarchaeota archaeon]|nr:leucine-rich repeat domain-containing protein [Candidatus Korarchaeota archaeon]NIU84583.1 hypothetical protein [Candidatus Thorarchaeota archaeon]NIW14641.1 hypothetical protein [Candidatus Thorarchaeota archaeon]NIW52718.1 hypothetical protein [Candidatus Korarchaeota archaeon]